MKTPKPKNDKTGRQPGKVSKAKQSGKKYSARSTATEAQIQRLIVLLRISPRHTHELRQHGISHPAGRVQNLEERGFVIASDRTTTVDGDGFIHSGVAIYSLVSEPEAAQ
jgi:hypothetical protein